jgi:ketosteroid isomerase-like protein
VLRLIPGRSLHCFREPRHGSDPDLAFVVENEQSQVKVGGRQDFSTVALRVTAIFRLEEGVWKIVHRYAETIVSNRPAEALIQR